MERNEILKVTKDSVKTLIKKFLEEKDEGKRLEIFSNYEAISLFKESVDDFLNVILGDDYEELMSDELFDFISNNEDKLYSKNIDINTTNLNKLLIRLDMKNTPEEITSEIEKFIKEHKVEKHTSIIGNKLIKFANLGELESTVFDYFMDTDLEDDSDKPVTDKVTKRILEEIKDKLSDDIDFTKYTNSELLKIRDLFFESKTTLDIKMSAMIEYNIRLYKAYKEKQAS